MNAGALRLKKNQGRCLTKLMEKAALAAGQEEPKEERSNRAVAQLQSGVSRPG